MANLPAIPCDLVKQILGRAIIAAYDRRDRIRLLESEFQAKLIDKLECLFPGCLILKNDSGYCQGIPDLVVFYGDRWGMLEVKANANSRVQANQPYYVSMLNDMSFAAFIYPSNEQEVLSALQEALQPRRNSRLPKR